ncbi:hypothetical protein KKR89_16490 [Cellulomonas dongxiuzhuiae]|uniref:Putative T7SS secretion signal domain-containing protein n=1 Tax=Cellulomonas dongxiuzhuiae TaxID=2819979 RepID=A0ABX8GI09_9CELL|nr:hypothetical protein [Cellulomonas dongxiuzhuiae]QWC15833.1 hypothetical protein KKR89_16490 [Cellulomonas dongxiuzhuiae]
MSRPYSWYPLASSDPVPGDPAVVRAGGDHYRQVAAAIGDAERVLRALVDAQDAVSEAVDAIRDRTHAVADRIRRAHARYDAAGDALVRYSIQLDLAQTESLDALHTARSAQHSLDLAEDAVRRSRILLEDATDLGEDTTTQQRALTSARTERSDAEIDLTRARLALAKAVERRDAAAARAMDELDTGMEDTLHDGWWEDWGADVAQTVSTWAGNISAGLGIASLLLGWVPVVGPIIMAAAVVAGAVALVADLALALKSGDGEDWFNVVMGVVGLASFGAGRVLARAVDAFDVSARAATSQAAGQATRSVVSRVTRLFSRSRAPDAPPAASAHSLIGGGPASSSRLAAAWDQVMSVRGWDRVLALAGHGELVGHNNVLRSRLWDAFPFQPRTFLTLLGPTVQGTLLETTASVLYVGDAAMAFTSTAKSVVDHVDRPALDPAQRLDL